MQRFALFVVAVLVSLYSCGAVAPIESSLVFSRGEGGYYCHKIPYLLRTMSNILIAFAEGRGKDGRDTCDDWNGTDLVMKRSEDNGTTWSDIRVLYSNSTGEDVNVIGNAAPVQDKSTGRIWIPFCKNNEIVYITYSDDDGLTFSEPVYMPDLVHSDWKWVGLGPPAGIQLTSGRLLIPAYHTTLVKGDGLLSRGHTLYSDDHGVTWNIGSTDFGGPYLSNECQAVELKDGSVMINARTVTNKRVQVVSTDGGITFGPPTVIDTLIQPLEGCEGSIVRDPITDTLYFSDPFIRTVTRINMTILSSTDDGATWSVFKIVDPGSVAYSALSIIPAPVGAASSGLELLYERSDNETVVFDPDQIIYYKVF